jgi:hypothetical protein
VYNIIVLSRLCTPFRADFDNFFITCRSYICSNLCTQKPLRIGVFLVCPLEPCQTCLVCNAHPVSFHPTYPTSRLAQSQGRTPQLGILHIDVWLLRIDAVRHSQESRCQGANLCKLRNTSTNPGQCKLSTFLNLATLHGRNL